MNMRSSTVKLSSGKLNPCIVPIVLVVLTASAAVFGMYYWQQQKIDDLNQRVSELESSASTKPIDELKTKLQEAQQSLLESVTYTSEKGAAIRVYVPSSDGIVQSPVIVLGEVPGDWSFEASFPIRLLDNEGDELAVTPAQLQSDWMTSELVPFIAKLELTTDYGGDAELVLEKDNPSGLDKKEDSVRIPVQITQ